jgi:hypothetical protein
VLNKPEEAASRERRLKGEDIQTIKLAVFIYALEEFFREGSLAAEKAVDEFKALGVRGFTVGPSLFEGRNENVIRGQQLAHALRAAVNDPELLSVIDQASTMRNLVLELRRRLRR